MYFQPWTLVVAASVAVKAAEDGTIGAFVDAKGITELFGNSFGRPGYNDTYDYIVSSAQLVKVSAS